MPLNAKLHIDTVQKKERTALSYSYCTQPFKVANVTEDTGTKELRLMLMSSSPGILDGDRYEMTIAVGEGCSLSLETQSFQRVFQMQQGAKQCMDVKLSKGSSFQYLPHPLVPHQGSIFQTRNRIAMEEGCSLLWGDVISCGRKLNGEVFELSLYHSLTEIYQNNKLIVKENLLLKPQQMDLHAIGQLEGFTHQATLLFFNDEARIPELIEQVRDVLNGEVQVMFGVSALPVNGLILRLLGYKAEQLFAQVKAIARLLQTAQPVPFKTPASHAV